MFLFTRIFGIFWGIISFSLAVLAVCLIAYGGYYTLDNGIKNTIDRVWRGKESTDCKVF